MSKNNNKKGLFTRVVALYNQLLTTIPLPPVSMFKAQSISPADRGAYCEHALKAGRSKCSIFVAERLRYGRVGVNVLAATACKVNLFLSEQSSIAV